MKRSKTFVITQINRQGKTSLKDQKVQKTEYFSVGFAATFTLVIPTRTQKMRTKTKNCFHLAQNISKEERMVASNAQKRYPEYMNRKPTRWGFKLIVLADSSSGYTVDFNVYTRKSAFPSEVGLAYATAMSLVKLGYLGTVYCVFVDNFYTIPNL